MNVTSNNGDEIEDKQSASGSNFMLAAVAGSVFVVLLVGGAVARRKRCVDAQNGLPEGDAQNTSGRRNTKMLPPLGLGSTSSFTFSSAERKNSLGSAWSPTASKFPRGSDQHWSPTFEEDDGSSLSALDEYIDVIDQLAGESTYTMTNPNTADSEFVNIPIDDVGWGHSGQQQPLCNQASPAGQAVYSLALQESPYVDMERPDQQQPFYDEASPSGQAVYSFAKQNNPESAYEDLEPVDDCTDRITSDYMAMDPINGAAVARGSCSPAAVDRIMTNSSYSELPPMIDAFSTHQVEDPIVEESGACNNSSSTPDRPLSRISATSDVSF